MELTSGILQKIEKQEYYSAEQFLHDCKRYVKAIKDGRIICNIESVSTSGMSRNIKFLECYKNTTRKEYQYLNFFAFFKILGYKESGKYKDCFKISGCGMDMVFHTNYTIIHKLGYMGIINKKTVDILAQKTPTII